MRKWWLLWMVTLMLAAGGGPGTDLRVAIVFDASGSMWGEIDGTKKIQIAKKALDRLLKGWNPRIPLGLTIYGHRSRSDCDDIETLIPARPGSAAAIREAVAPIRPKGKTPITRALKRVAEELGYRRRPATIILITDGRETCDADPVAAVERLRAEGVDLKIHVVGFDVGKEVSAELGAIAKAGGGRYLPARSAAELVRAFRTLSRSVKEKAPPKPPKHNLILSASERPKGPEISADYTLVPLDGTERRGCSSAPKSPCRLKLPAGRYRVEARYSLYRRERDVSLNELNVTRVRFVMGETGELLLTAEEGKKGRGVPVSFDLLRPEGNRSVASGTTEPDRAVRMRLPAGSYRIRTRYLGLSLEVPAEVPPGKSTSLRLLLPPSNEVILSASETEEGPPVSADFFLDADSNVSRTSRYRCHTEPERPCRIRLPIGRYRIQARYRQMRRTERLELPPGKAVRRRIVMKPTGLYEITVREKKGGAPVAAALTLYPEGSSGPKSTPLLQGRSSPHRTTLLKLFEGRYRLEADYCGYHRAMPIAIRGGERGRGELIMGTTGYLRASARLHRDTPLLKARFLLFSGEENATSPTLLPFDCERDRNGSCLYHLPTGRYRIVAEYGPRRRSREVEIPEGRTRSVTFIMEPLGRAILSVHRRRGGPPITASHDVYAATDLNGTSLLAACRSVPTTPCTLELPVGRYRLVTEAHPFTVTTPLEIREDQVGHIVVLTGEVAEINATSSIEGSDEAPMLYYYLYREKSDGEPESLSYQSCALCKRPSFTVPPGRYELRTSYGIQKRRRELTLRPGEFREVHFRFHRPIPVTIRLLDEKGEVIRRDAYLRPDPPKEELEKGSVICTYHGKIDACSVKLPPAAYSVEFFTGRRSVKMPITIDRNGTRFFELRATGE